jgi:hypothetical protein
MANGRDEDERWGWVAVSFQVQQCGRQRLLLRRQSAYRACCRRFHRRSSTTGDAGMAAISAYVPDRTDGTGDAVYTGDLLFNLALDVTHRSSTARHPQITVLTDASAMRSR